MKCQKCFKELGMISISLGQRTQCVSCFITKKVEIPIIPAIIGVIILITLGLVLGGVITFPELTNQEKSFTNTIKNNLKPVETKQPTKTTKSYNTKNSKKYYITSDDVKKASDTVSRSAKKAGSAIKSFNIQLGEESKDGIFTTKKTTTKLGWGGLKKKTKNCPFWNRDC